MFNKCSLRCCFWNSFGAQNSSQNRFKITKNRFRAQEASQKLSKRPQEASKRLQKASKRPPTSSKEPPGSLKTLSEMPPRHLFKWCLQNVMRELTLRSQSKKLVAKESLLWTWNKSKLKELNTFSELSLFVLQVGEHVVFSPTTLNRLLFPVRRKLQLRNSWVKRMRSPQHKSTDLFKKQH